MPRNVDNDPTAKWWLQKPNVEYQWDPFKDQDFGYMAAEDQQATGPPSWLHEWLNPIEPRRESHLVHQLVANDKPLASTSHSYNILQGQFDGAQGCESKTSSAFQLCTEGNHSDLMYDAGSMGALGTDVYGIENAQPELLPENPMILFDPNHKKAVEGEREPVFQSGFMLGSGCRPIGQYTDDEQQMEIESSSSPLLRCQHPGCTSKRTYSRKYELRRHMQKHAPQATYPCPVLGCAYIGSRFFYRPDKLKVHLRMSHRDDAPSRCPVQDCLVTTQVPLAFLSAHAEFHFDGSHLAIPVVRDFLKNHGQRVSRCPIGDSRSCGKWIETTELPSHIVSHSEEDRLKFRTDALEAGYDSNSGHLVCPICFELVSDPEKFATHIHMQHLFEPGSEGAQRFSAFYFSLRGFPKTPRWSILPALWSGNLILVAGGQINCPTCALPLVKRDYFGRCFSNMEHIKEHMTEHKTDITEVFQHRRQILKHYPEFVNHPVFDDLRVTLPSSSTEMLQ